MTPATERQVAQAIPPAVMITQQGRQPCSVFLTKYAICASSAEAGGTTTGPVGGNDSMRRLFSHAPIRGYDVVVDRMALLAAATRPAAAAATVLVVGPGGGAPSVTGETSAAVAVAAAVVVARDKQAGGSDCCGVA